MVMGIEDRKLLDSIAEEKKILSSFRIVYSG
jgi:hypothetical protein